MALLVRKFERDVPGLMGWRICPYWSNSEIGLYARMGELRQLR